MLLTAAMIVRDEAAHLERCLQSIEGFVDEVVVVDTGSTDGTAAMAEARGATVVRQPWRGDFAEARNAALDRAGGRWILYIDADERVVRVGDLRPCLEDEGNVAALVRFRVQSGYTRYWEHRLFRNRGDIRFRGVIHETPVPDIHAVIRREGGGVVCSEVEVDHLGYEGDQRHKYRRDLPLLIRATAADPDRSYLWHRLGQARLGLGDAEGAEAAWVSGVGAARARESGRPVDVLCFADLALHQIGLGQDCSLLIAEMQQRFGGDHLVRWVTARHSMANGRFDAALAPLLELVAVDADSLVHPCLAYDRRMFGELAFSALGTCLFQLGDHRAAASWFAKAATADPRSEEYRVKLALAEAHAARASREETG